LYTKREERGKLRLRSLCKADVSRRAANLRLNTKADVYRWMKEMERLCAKYIRK
jgi:hypothetical protein